MAAPAEVGRLVEQFGLHRQRYRASEYGEAQLREEFINPFFKALGWDVYNEQGRAGY
jgi:predicted type IV restriction endonuclease